MGAVRRGIKAVVIVAGALLAIADWHAGLTPEGKVGLLQEVTARRGPVAIVGDGLNDGPVLAAAAVAALTRDLGVPDVPVAPPAEGDTGAMWLIDANGVIRAQLRPPYDVPLPTASYLRTRARR